VNKSDKTGLPTPDPGVPPPAYSAVCGRPDAFFFTPDGRLCGECAYSRGVRFAVPNPNEWWRTTDGNYLTSPSNFST